MSRAILLGAVLAAIAAPGVAEADEAWHTPDRDVFWETDTASHTVFGVNPAGQTAAEPAGRIFLEGPVPAEGGRGTYAGYWVDYSGSGERCAEAKVDELGNEAWTWGDITLVFDQPSYPSGWAAKVGTCGQPADQAWTAEPN